MAYATPEDVAKELRGSTSVSDVEAVQWQTWLDRVRRSIERGFTRAGLNLDDQINLGTPTEADVNDVMISAVLRKIANPKWGESSTTVTIDDGQLTRRYEGATGDPLVLLAEDWTALLPGSPSSGWSTRPGFAPDVLPDVYRPYLLDPRP